jgi:ATP-dependent Clp protease ATP-binding subunit ClpA
MSFLSRITKWFIRDDSAPEFTDRAIQSMAIARKIALHRQKSIIESDDLLAGMCAVSAGLAFDTLNRCGPKPADILAHFGVSNGWHNLTATTNLPYYDSVKIILALAMRESKSEKCSHVGTDHILIAMFDHQIKNTSDYFKDRGISRKDIEAKLAEIKKEPNQALEPTTFAVTSRAPSSTSRASEGRGSS